MKIVLILILLLFGACSEKPEKVEYVTLVEGEIRFRGVQTTSKSIRCPKPGEYFILKKYDIIYAVNCVKINEYFIKTISIGQFSNHIRRRTYHYINNYVLLIRDLEFEADDGEKILFKNDSLNKKLNDEGLSSLHVEDEDPLNNRTKKSSLIKDNSFFYEMDKNGNFELKYARILETYAGDYGIKTRKYELYEYKIYKNEENLYSMAITSSKNDINKVVQIFIGYDKNNGQTFFNSDKLGLEKKMNIGIDFEVPYKKQYDQYLTR